VNANPKPAGRDLGRETSPPARPSHRKQPFPSIRWDRKRFAFRIGEVRTSGWRLVVQVGFTLVSIGIGIQFARFVDAARKTTAGPLPVRPPGVEGYLPISGLMGLLDWIHEGTLNTVHPAATVLFLAFVAGSFLFRKSFCSWICPVGFLSEGLARFGRWMFGSNLRPPRWLDVPLRALKYLLLGFFLWAIFGMSAAALRAFIESPYNKVSDVKMLSFFTNMGTVGLGVVLALVILSIPIQGFWCRYLCPYGALLGMVSWLSPMRVRRDPMACTDCGICDRVCPARLPVSRVKSVGSVECIGCTDCVVSCPVRGALRFGTARRTVRPFRVGIVVVGLMIVAMLAARAGSRWHSGISAEEMRLHVQRSDSGAYGHPGMGGGR
jgi:ferredoxin